MTGGAAADGVVVSFDSELVMTGGVVVSFDSELVMTGGVVVSFDSEEEPIRPITLLTAFDMAFATLMGVAGIDSSFVAIVDGGNAATRF